MKVSIQQIGGATLILHGTDAEELLSLAAEFLTDEDKMNWDDSGLEVECMPVGQTIVKKDGATTVKQS